MAGRRMVPIRSQSKFRWQWENLAATMITVGENCQAFQYSMLAFSNARRRLRETLI